MLRCSFVPFSNFRVGILRLFGAQIGRGVVIKPGVRVKFPWRLSIGDSSWIGEEVWIDNLASVEIAAHVCISQGAYLCTGNHDWSLSSFELRTNPIQINASAWIAAKTVLGPGCVVGEGAVLLLGSVAFGNLEPWTIYMGNPALVHKKRVMQDEPGAP